MIFVSGDIHGNPVRFSTDSFYEQKEFSGNKDENLCIILGDFGLVWNRDGEDKNEKWWLDWLEDKPFSVVFLDGNHENHLRLAEYPVKEWNGGLVHEIRPHVLHLMRGNVYTIQGKKFFCFGGASSHDVSDGILDIDDPDINKKIKKMKDEGKYMYRIRGLDWWAEELPSEEEMENGRQNLEKHNWKVDYIISHDCAASTLALLSQGAYKPNIVNKYLEEIHQKCDYKLHLFGHHHINKQVTAKDICLYEQIIRIF